MRCCFIAHHWSTGRMPVVRRAEARAGFPWYGADGNVWAEQFLLRQQILEHLGMATGTWPWHPKFIVRGRVTSLVPCDAEAGEGAVGEPPGGLGDVGVGFLPGGVHGFAPL